MKKENKGWQRTWCEKFHMKQKIDLGQKTINNKNYSGRLQVQIVSLAYT